MDTIDYLLSLCPQNKLARQNNFKPSHTASVADLQPLMEQYQTTPNHYIVIDTTEGNLSAELPGRFDRRTYTIAILSHVATDSYQERRAKLLLCREIMRQVLSRIEYDTEASPVDELMYIQRRATMYQEVFPAEQTGTTGVILYITFDEPTDLCFNPDEWSGHGQE